MKVIECILLAKPARSAVNLVQRRANSSTLNRPGYVQGQYVKEGSPIREYFYHISEEGYLFLSDTKHKNFTSAFKDKQFLKFFFDRLQRNTTDRYAAEFPFLSRCGYERNYIQVDDCPIVYTHVIGSRISYNYGGELMAVQFEPAQICMCPRTGRVYYPTIERYGELALVRSKLAIELSKHFVFDKKRPEGKQDGLLVEPVAIEWDGKRYELSYQLKPLLMNRQIPEVGDSS